MIRLFILWICSPVLCLPQDVPHPNAHAHNDYEHSRPLKEALANGFVSVEADVHLQGDRLLVSHDRPNQHALTLQALYLSPIDSILKVNHGAVYNGSNQVFYLMIDCKTEAGTYQAIRESVSKYPELLCTASRCPVKIFLSGNRPIPEMMKDGYIGLGIDGRPGDLGKGYTAEMMPVISDHYGNWSTWNGKAVPSANDLSKIKDLAQRVHAEGKKLRLWAIPDNEVAWKALLGAGVDFINTDHLVELNKFLTSEGL